MITQRYLFKFVVKRSNNNNTLPLGTRVMMGGMRREGRNGREGREEREKQRENKRRGYYKEGEREKRYITENREQRERGPKVQQRETLFWNRRNKGNNDNK